MKERLSTGILLFIFALNAIAQSVKVVGKVSNAKGIPVEFATISLKDDFGKFVCGCMTDSLGLFKLTTGEQKFVLHISCIGYRDYQRTVNLSHTDSIVNVDVILEDSTKSLGEVTVKGKKPLIKREIDKIVFDAERLNAVSQTFLDVLKYTPGVIVTDDGVSMVGKGNVIFLVNSRELKMDDKEILIYLNSLSSSELKSIEVMTTPPAKYTAEGNAGIINVVTRTRTNDYLGGTLSDQVSIKKYLYNDASANLQYKKGKVQAFLDLGLGNGKTDYKDNERVAYDSESWNTDAKRTKSNDYISSTSGVDLALGKNTSIGAIASFFSLSPDAYRDAKTQVFSKDSGQLVKDFVTITKNKRNSKRYSANLHFEQNNIGKGGNLKIDFDDLKYRLNDHDNLQTLNDEDLSYVDHPHYSIDIYSAKADAELPFSKGLFSYGMAYTHTKNDSHTEYEKQNFTENLNDHFIYKENVFAVYTDATYDFSKRLKSKFGVRGEYSHIKGLSKVTDSKNTYCHFDVFPTAYISYSWSDENVLSWSATGRINRPDYSDINPFVLYIDAHTIFKGNAGLLPEKSYSTEVNYNYKNFTVSGSFLFRNHIIGELTEFDNAQRRTTITMDNIMKTQMYELFLSYYFDQFPWMDNYFEGDLYTLSSSPLKNSDMGKTHQVSVFLYMNHNIYLNKAKTLIVHLSGNFNSRQKDSESEQRSRFRMDMGGKYLFFHKSLALDFKFENFLSSHIKSIIVSNGTRKTTDSEPYRAFVLSLSYNFGEKIQRKHRSENIDTDRL
ncbi:TonB-dependent receptor family protein [Prevotella cerevisiae]|uniref:TonB-dependent receptor family protein n=1 Tax=Segatella cerevisiae TaxID=2053716 RepID=A0ABT1BU93_9BACT|nr:outer membrane beta-barrel family protein [Segatella cerevisiae]MCO6024652.1 TonB-dependent receptor family protein [Segatella cerevisiae]